MAVDKKTALYQALWRKAAAMTTPVEIPCRTVSDAKYLRLELYRAVKMYRENPVLDPELTQATELCAVSVRSGAQISVVMARKALQDNVMDVAKALGIDLDSLSQAPKDLEEVDALASQERMMKKLMADPSLLTGPVTQAAAAPIPTTKPCPDCHGSGKRILPDDSIINCQTCSPAPTRTNPYYVREPR